MGSSSGQHSPFVHYIFIGVSVANGGGEGGVKDVSHLSPFFFSFPCSFRHKGPKNTSVKNYHSCLKNPPVTCFLNLFFTRVVTF